MQDHRSALSVVPSDSTAWTGITQILKEHPEAEEEGMVNWSQVASDMSKASDQAEREGDTRAMTKLAFAQFTAHHSMGKKGNPALAFKHLQNANQWEFERHHDYPQMKQQLNLQMQHTMSIFKKGAWIDGVGSKSKVPVFIVGMMRSGSSLLEQILASHEQVEGIGEDSVFSNNAEMIVDGVGKAVGQGSMSALVEVIESNANKIVEDMMAMIPETKRGKVTRIIDKQLFSFKQLGLIHLVFPDAIILESTRNFMDVLFSIYRFNFNEVI